jgi:Cys-tRNA(Pro)/Cys-tRNA(Cys) deacylase
MTPAIQLAKKQRIPFSVHEYQHERSSESYGLEAAEKMGVPATQVFKTLVVQLDNGNLAVAVIPVCEQLSMKRVAKAAGARKAQMAKPDDVQRSTGYILGGVSPLGQKKRLLTLIDSSAENQETVYVSAGRRGLEIELSPGDLGNLTGAVFTGLTPSA